MSESLPPCLEMLTIRGSSDFHPDLLEKLLTSPAREFLWLGDIYVGMEEERYEELKQECTSSRLAL